MASQLTRFQGNEIEMQIVRHPWTSDLTETLVSRVFEFYLKEKYPTTEIGYFGRDFPISMETKHPRAIFRSNYFTGALSDDPMRFLELQPEIHALIGVQINLSHSTSRDKMGVKELFLSETFRREFSSHNIATRDLATNQFLFQCGIESKDIGCVSFLLSSLSLDLNSLDKQKSVLLIDIYNEETLNILTKTLKDESHKVVTTKIPEISGETRKNSLIDSIFKILRDSSVVITSNPNIAVPALSFGKKVLLITNKVHSSIPFSEFMRVIDHPEILKELNSSSVTDLATCMPREEIIKRQGMIEEFINQVLQNGRRQRMRAETSDYRNQVVSEVVNALLAKVELLETEKTQFHTLLESRSWKATAPLRRAIELKRRLKGG